MKKLLIVLFFTNISNAQMTRAEILEMAVTLDWKIESATSNKISITAFKSENELGILPLQYSELTFDGSSQNSKLIKVREVKSTKVKYVAEANFKDAPRVKESRVINSYKGEKYCSCYYYFKDARVRVTKYPVKVENKTAFYYIEYETENYSNAYSSSGSAYKGTTNSSGSYRAKEIARNFDENKSSTKNYSSKYDNLNYRGYLKTGDYTLHSEARFRSEVLHKIKGGVRYRVIKKGLSYTLIETDKGERGYILTYSLKN